MHEVLTLDRLRSMTPDAAAALLVYRRADGGPQLDAPLLAQWLADDPGIRAAWADAQAAWADFDGSEDDDILAALRADARRAGPERRRWNREVVAAAAAVVLVVVGALAITLRHPGGPDAATVPAIASSPAGTRSYVSPRGEWRSFRLADGSQMTLDAGSAAEVALNGAGRQVRLVRGQAFFDVASDPVRPFAVKAGGQEIRALGTQFDVRLRPGEMRVVLVEGRVSVRPQARPRSATLLEAGQQLVARDGAAPQVSAADLRDATAWRARFIDFDDIALAAAAAEMNRYGPDRLIVRDPGVAALRISGRFRAGDPVRFGRSIASLHPVRVVQRAPDQWELVPVR